MVYKLAISGLRVSIVRPVLFLPGTLCDERIFMPMWKHMNINQRRFVPLQWANSLEDMLALTSDRVLSDEKVHVVGYSMGGFIAAKWASLHAEQVASLTLIGYDGYGLSADEIARRKQMVSLLKNGNFRLDNPQYLARFVHSSQQQNENVVGVVREMGEDLGKNTLLAHTQATTPRDNMVNTLAKLTVPTCIIAARDDNIAQHSNLVKMADTISGAILHTMSDSGHMLPLEQPAELAERVTSFISA